MDRLGHAGPVTLPIRFELGDSVVLTSHRLVHPHLELVRRLSVDVVGARLGYFCPARSNALRLVSLVNVRLEVELAASVGRIRRHILVNGALA